MTDNRKPSSELAEDFLGFGGRDVVTARDLLLRPASVLQAWMESGAEGGGRYARPLRLYLALNAVLMLVLFLTGGAGFILAGFPPEAMAPLLRSSGKSMDAFVADADGWMTLVMVPLLAVSHSLAAVPFIRLWDPEDLGWRKGFRATFGWLCAWTVPMLPLTWLTYGEGPLAATISTIILALGVVAFFRMGRGRWFTSGVMGILKGVFLMMAVQISAMVAGVLVGGIGILGALFSP